ncbi:hypothetical protein [Mycobacterium montefiorense]|uniref:hypothetical protein n=1 Tax=Mycobacterium montefiorense TaxID=154654 RepID=UPI001057B500|nr:hypothetical protein [Mycobacterium montefiorense]
MRRGQSRRRLAGHFSEIPTPSSLTAMARQRSVSSTGLAFDVCPGLPIYRLDVHDYLVWAANAGVDR